MSATLQNTFASLPATTRGKPFVLNGDPKGENFLYACGNSIVIRNIHNPKVSELYDQHSFSTTVAKYSPSGYYIASADSAGNVRIWDTLNKEHILKAEYHVLGGAILDLDWSDDSKRIVVGGDGREKYGHAFFMETGASVGEITNHTKVINSVTFKQTRPYRVATGSEDFAVNWYEGPPFKFKKRFTGHSRFVNCVRFSPNGNLLASASSDKTVLLYDGKTGDQTATLTGHNGGVYSCSWNADSTRLLTASADKTCKIWDVATGQAITTFTFENEVENQQLGCLWQGNYLLSVNLSGHISYLDESNPSKPLRVLKGHNKFVTSLAVDKENNSFYSGSYDAAITRWNIDSGENTYIEGNGHKNQIVDMTVDNGNLIAGAMDDSVSVSPIAGNTYGPSVGVDSLVVGVAATKGQTVSATLQSVYVISNNHIGSQVAAPWGPASIAISPDGSEVAVGGNDNKIHLFSLSGGKLTEKGLYEGHRGPVTALDYSPDGKYLGSGGKDRYVFVWDRSNGKCLVDGWVFHASTVNSVAWNPDSIRIASASLDQNLIVWNLNTPNKKVDIKGAHRGGANVVRWLDGNTLYSAGQDCSVKSWTITA